MKPKPDDVHLAICADGKKRPVKYQYWDCKHCHWKKFVTGTKYTECNIYQKGCKHENNPFDCEDWEV